MSNQTPNWKSHIVELLGMLASEEQQLAYEKNVPHVDITAELVCMWFDDQYHPEGAGFISCFTPAELAALAEFHSFYEEREKKLPKSQGTVRTWLASPIWREIMRKAHDTLERVAA